MGRMPSPSLAPLPPAPSASGSAPESSTCSAGRPPGELADGWIPTLFRPGHIDLFRDELEAGAKISGRSLDSLAIAPHVPVSIDDDRARARETLKPWVALYVGGMGSRTKNFYND